MKVWGCQVYGNEEASFGSGWGRCAIRLRYILKNHDCRDENRLLLVRAIQDAHESKQYGHLATVGLSYFYLLINGGIWDFKRGLVVPLLPVHELSCGTIKMYLGTPLAACQ